VDLAKHYKLAWWSALGQSIKQSELISVRMGRKNASGDKKK